MENLFAFYPYTEYLSEIQFLNNALICLALDILRQNSFLVFAMSIALIFPLGLQLKKRKEKKTNKKNPKQTKLKY